MFQLTQPIFLTFKLNIDSASLSIVALKILSTFTVQLGETVNAVRHAFLKKKKKQQHSIRENCYSSLSMNIEIAYLYHFSITFLFTFLL